MAFTVACISLLVVGLAALLMFIRPQWVFYLFLVSALFGNVLGGYVYAAGNLGMPRAWQPADLLVWLTLFSTILVPRPAVPPNGLHRCFLIIAIMIVLSLVLGLTLHPKTALTFSRSFHFVAAMFFATRYFVTLARVEAFFKFVTGLLLVMFLVHVCIRLRLYVPPISEEQATGQMQGERGEMALVMGGYLVLLSIAIARLTHKRPFAIVSAGLVFIGLIGIVLSETRALYAVTVFLGLVALLFVRGRVKTLMVYGLAAIMAVVSAAQLGFDVTSRFRAKFGRGDIVVPFSEGDWRTLEYGMLLRSYVAEPMFVLTGRGIGAMHYIPMLKMRKVSYYGYYHSEYLSWLDRLGLIGFFTYLSLLGLCLVWSYRLFRSGLQPFAFYGTAVFLAITALMAQGVAWPTFMNGRGAPLYVCLVVVIANWQRLRCELAPSRAISGGAESPCGQWGRGVEYPPPRARERIGRVSRAKY